MVRLDQTANDLQIPLPLETEDQPRAEGALRRAYRGLQISRRVSFEEAMSDTALAICLRNLAAVGKRP